MHDNLNNEKKEHIKIEDWKRKKTNRDNLDNNEKEQLKKYGKKERRTNVYKFQMKEKYFQQFPNVWHG